MTFVSPSLILLIAALSIAAPARAQDAPRAEVPAEAAATVEAAPQPDTTTDAAEEAISPEEAAFNERSAALSRRVLAVDEEMKSAARLAALDPQVAKAALDDIQTAFQAEMDAFIQDFFNLAAQKFTALPEAEQQTLRTNVENTAGQLATLPQSMRDRAEAAALLPPPSQVAPSSN